MGFLQYLAYTVLLFVAYIILTKVIPSIQFKSFYSRQGVPFAPGWSFITDMKALTAAAIEDPISMPVYPACHKVYGNVLPPVWGMFLGPFRAIMINAPEYLEEIYVKHNAFHSKHDHEKQTFNLLNPTTITFLPSED
jgi:hypothetical protein